MADWYRKEELEVISVLNTSAEKGLPAAEAQRCLVEYGPNELVELGLKSSWRILTNALSSGELLLSLVLSTVVFWGVELEKWFMRRGGVRS